MFTDMSAFLKLSLLGAKSSTEKRFFEQSLWGVSLILVNVENCARSCPYSDVHECWLVCNWHYILLKTICRYQASENERYTILHTAGIYQCLVILWFHLTLKAYLPIHSMHWSSSSLYKGAKYRFQCSVHRRHLSTIFGHAL